MYSFPPLPSVSEPLRAWAESLVTVLGEVLEQIAGIPQAASKSEYTTGSQALGDDFAEVAELNIAVTDKVLVTFSAAVSLDQAVGAKTVNLRLQRGGSDLIAEEEVLGTEAGSATVYGTVGFTYLDETGEGEADYDVDMRLPGGGTSAVTRRSLVAILLRE